MTERQQQLQDRPWTPGPWQVHRSDSAGGPSSMVHLGRHPHEGGRLEEYGGDYRSIASVHSSGYNADDLLIALAPELAEAVLAWVEDHPIQTTMPRAMESSKALSSLADRLRRIGGDA